MKRLLLFALLIVSITLSGCTSKEISASYPFLDNSGSNEPPITILFSNDTDIHKELNYYNALIDTQQKYPNKLSDVKVISSSEQELIDYYEIDTFPTLLLVDELEVKLKIEGTQDFSSIYKKIEFTLYELNNL